MSRKVNTNKPGHISVESAINRGVLVVYTPLIVFMFAAIAGGLYYSKHSWANSEVYTVIAFFMAIMLGWIWWSYQIVKWKIWAFTNISDEEIFILRTKAIQVGLIWPHGSFFNNTEVWTKNDKTKWNQLDEARRNAVFHKQ